MSRSSNKSLQERLALVPTSIVPSPDRQELLVSSRVLATVFGKEHFHVLRSIREIESQDPDFFGSNFRANHIKVLNNPAGQEISHYDLTEAAFTLVAMSFTGAEATRFKVAYIGAYKAMREALRSTSVQLTPPAGTQSALSLNLQMIEGLLNNAKQVTASIAALQTTTAQVAETVAAVADSRLTPQQQAELDQYILATCRRYGLHGLSGIKAGNSARGAIKRALLPKGSASRMTYAMIAPSQLSAAKQIIDDTVRPWGQT